MKTKRLLGVLLVVSMVFAAVFTLVACAPAEDGYTYRAYSTALGTNWNPHTWEMNADQSIMEQISIGLVDTVMAKEGEFKWQYEMATDIQDITASATDADKTKWGIGEGATGRMWKITLNPNAKFENGKVINADTYVESMKLQLDPELQNYRANSYTENDFEIVGAKAYYNQGKSGYFPAVELDTYGDNLSSLEGLYFDATNVSAFGGIFGTSDMTKLGDYKEYFQVGGEEGYNVYDDLVGFAGDKRTAMTEEIKGKLAGLFGENGKLGGYWEWADSKIGYLTVASYTYPKVNFDTVGLYKTGEYEIVYVCKNNTTRFNFLIMCNGASWIVEPELYKSLITEKGGVKTSSYGTSKDTSVAYGPYKIASLQKDKQIVYVQNENWYGWERDDKGNVKKDDKGSLISYTTLNGEKVRQFVTTKYVVDVMTDEAAKQAFLKGDLDELALASEDVPAYSASERLTKVDETYTMRFFFNTSCTTELDKGTANKNSVVLQSEDFRHAFSLAINRAEFCTTATSGFKPAFALINTLYYYDAENDPSSIYRTSEWGKKAIVDLYGVEYGEGKTYKTLDEAYASVNGYDLTAARKLMKSACDALVAAGKYKAGEEITIQVAYSAAASSSSSAAQEKLLNDYLNAAIEGSGFGKITLKFVYNLQTRYDDVMAGKYAIGWGAWGGAAFYPFKMFEVYLEPDTTAIHESGSFDPKTETMTIEEFTYTDSKGATQTFAKTTKTWEKWSQYLKAQNASGADINLLLALLSKIEEAYVGKYYCIPVCGTTVVSLTGYKVENATDTYNIMYGFGGMRLLKYNYSDSAWTDYVKKQGGNLSYE